MSKEDGVVQRLLKRVEEVKWLEDEYTQYVSALQAANEDKKKLKERVAELERRIQDQRNFFQNSTDSRVDELTQGIRDEELRNYNLQAELARRDEVIEQLKTYNKRLVTRIDELEASDVATLHERLRYLTHWLYDLTIAAKERDPDVPHLFEYDPLLQRMLADVRTTTRTVLEGTPEEVAAVAARVREQ